MDFIIDHKRFKKVFHLNELDKYLWSDKRISKFPHYLEKYFQFFNDYAKKNYKLIPNKCLCHHSNDLLLSKTDRHCVEFYTVVCKNCGLIRAKDYFSEKDVKNFYENYYRPGSNFGNISYGSEDLDKFFNNQFVNSKFRFDLINKYKKKDIHNLKILDLGGGIGGILKHFDRNGNELFLADYFDPYINYAKSKGYKVIKGGLNEINFKPNIIILSHVIEHWSNFEEQIKKLINIQIVGETINYIEFPGIDSLKLGRREGDILGDIHVPHVYYFSSYVFENIMNRYGFEKLYIDSEIKSIFVYTGKKKDSINYYPKIYQDLILAERKRKIHCVQNFIKLFIPNNLLSIVSKIRGKKINF